MNAERLKKRSRLLLGLSLCLLAGALGAGLWAVTHRPRQVWRVPDGSVLTLEGSTYSERQIVLGEWWQKLFTPVLRPHQRPRVVSLPNQQGWFDTPALVYWFTYRSTAHPMARPSLFERRSPWWQLLDETGYSLGPTYDIAGGGIPNAPGVEFVFARVFPRRGRSVRLRYFGSDLRKPACEFVVPNPLPGPYPVWQPSPLPITSPVGELSCELVELTTGLKSRKDVPIELPGEPPCTRGTLRILRNGRPTRDWEPIKVTLSDATGNILALPVERLVWQKDRVRFYLMGSLSPDEAAWKMRVELSRTPRATFAPGEKWTLRGIPMPRGPAISKRSVSTRLSGVQLQFLGLAGVGKNFFLINGNAYWYKPRIGILVFPPLDGMCLSVSARDEQGRVYAGYTTGYDPWPWQNGSIHEQNLNLPPSTRKVDLTFLLHRSRFAEFLARPSRAQK